MMKKLYATCIVLVSFVWGAWAQSPAIKWQKAASTDTARIEYYEDGSYPSTFETGESPGGFLQKADGSYVCLSQTSSIPNTSTFIKFNSAGDTLFSKRLPSLPLIWGVLPNGNYVFQTFAYSSMSPTADGGYILAATKAGNTTYDSDALYLVLLKIDADGNTQWKEEYRAGEYVNATSVSLIARSVVVTADGGFLLLARCGNLVKGKDKTADPIGGIDYWLIKTDAAGLIEWDKTIGGTGADEPSSLLKTNDGGYIISGYSNSPASGNKSADPKGDMDIWLVKINATGDVVWDKTVGTTGTDRPGFITSTADGGFFLGARTEGGMDGDKTEPSLATDYWTSEAGDMWVLKFDGTGNIQWQRTLGGSGNDQPRSVYQDADGGFVIGATSNSGVSANKTVPSFGTEYFDDPAVPSYWIYFDDYWVLKLTPTGDIVWQTVLGGLGYDRLTKVLPTIDGGVLVVGSSGSEISGNRSIANKSAKQFIYNGDVINSLGNDIWLVKLDPETLPVSLLSFTGHSPSSGTALLQWETATEENFSHFELEKSMNLQYYSKVVNVAAKGNNSNYGYTDNISNGITYYRLKMVDKDGTATYSNIVTITGGGEAIITIAPNPVPSGATLTMLVPPATKNAFWQIIGIDGKLYGTQTISNGATQVKIDTKTLAKGTYSLVYTQGNERKVLRFIKN